MSDDPFDLSNKSDNIDTLSGTGIDALSSLRHKIDGINTRLDNQDVDLRRELDMIVGARDEVSRIALLLKKDYGELLVKERRLLRAISSLKAYGDDVVVVSDDELTEKCIKDKEQVD